MSELLWNDTFSNLTWSNEIPPEDEISAVTKLTTALGSLVCMAIILSNLLLLTILVTEGNWNRNPYKIILAHLCCLDLAVGILVVPLLLHYVFGGNWKLGVALCEVWIAVDHFLLVLIHLSWLILSVDRLLFAFRPEQYRSVVRAWVALLMVWLPWTLGLIITGPLYYKSSTKTFVRIMQCYNEWNLDHYLIFIVLTYFVPFCLSCLVFVLCLIVMIQSRVVTLSQRTSSSLNADRSSAQKSTLIMGLTNISITLMCLPFFAFTVSEIQSRYTNDVESWVGSLLYWVTLTNSAIRPLFWLLIKDIKRDCRQLLRNIWCGPKPPSQDQCTQTNREKEVRFIDFDCTKLKSADV